MVERDEYPNYIAKDFFVVKIFTLLSNPVKSKQDSVAANRSLDLGVIFDL